MNGTLYTILLIAVTYMLIKNMRKAKEIRKDQAYIDAYMKILKKDLDAGSNLKNYIENEADEELKNRAQLVALYQAITKDENEEEVLNNLDVAKAFFDDDKVNLEKVTTNSDSFIWLILNLAVAKNKNKEKVMDEIFTPLKKHDDELKSVVEYNITKAVYEYLLNANEDILSFPKQLLSGDYAGYHYDKQLIGSFKKLAAALLAYAKQPLDEDCKAILSDFSTTQVGNIFMKNLGIVEEYLPKVETN